VEAALILRVGLTGGIASGKSSVGRTLAGLGCVVTDADDVVARLYRPGQAGFEALLQTYGREILRPDGEVDRKKLANIAFTDTESTKRLNSLIHPLVIAQEEAIIGAEAARFPDRDRIVVVEATLLLEAGRKKGYDKIVVVDSEPDVQIDRAVRRGISGEDARRRLAQQMEREERLRNADYVIKNDGNMHSLERETFRVYEKLRGDLVKNKDGMAS
jgi:dephospho-CoA kinase